MIQVIVTAQDIKAGEKGNGHTCPIAIAIRRALQELEPGHRPKAYMACVGSTGGAYGIGRRIKHFAAHASLSIWIAQYDRGLKSDPTSFQIPAL